MHGSWQIRDLIDLEYFLGRKFDESTGETASDDVDFDRRAYRSFPDQSVPADTTEQRRRLIRHWLEERRKYEKKGARIPPALPGEAFSETMRLMRLLLAATAFVFGAGLTWGLLSYTGREPVNVFTCLWVLVAPQVILLLILLLSAVFYQIRKDGSFKLVYPLLTAILHGMMQRIGRFAAKKMDAGRADRIREVHALLGKTRTVYGSVFFWPVFLLAQGFALFFNAGILGAMFLKVAITDLAFGWQTTLQVSQESVLQFVETVALPWAWLFSPPVSHPTLEQIAGSRMILKDGIFHLATADLASWWPFIFLAVLFYGFLPRLLLAGAGFILKRRAIQAIGFNHGACDRLIMRMKTPRVETKSAPYQAKGADETGGAPWENGPERAKGAGTPAIVVVPAEIHEMLKGARLDKTLADTLGMHTAAVIPAEMDVASDSRRLRDALLEKQDADASIRIVVFQEAWQPPIKENMAWIKALRAAAGGTGGMVIALIGEPGRDTGFTPPSTTDRKIWEQAVNLMKDPYVRTESIGEQPGE